MATWNGYFVVLRGTLSSGNWSNLVGVLAGLGPDSAFLPAQLNHQRLRLDGNGIIYEAVFDANEVSQEAFKTLLAAEFGVSEDDIAIDAGETSYGGVTRTWAYRYPGPAGDIRFTIERFGGGAGTLLESRQECWGFLLANKAAWGY